MRVKRGGLLSSDRGEQAFAWLRTRKGNRLPFQRNAPVLQPHGCCRKPRCLFIRLREILTPMRAA